MKKYVFFNIVLSIFIITNLSAQDVFIKGGVKNSPDPGIAINVPIDGKYFAGAVHKIKLDNNGGYQYKLRLTKPAFVTLTNNWNTVKLFVEPGNKYVCDFLLKEKNQFEINIDGYNNEANNLLNNSGIVKDTRELIELLDKYNTALSKHQFLDSMNAATMAHFSTLYKNGKASKSFIKAVSNELNVAKLDALGTDYYFLFRSTEDGKDSVKYQSFKQNFLKDWKYLYNGFNDSLQWLNSTFYGSMLYRYLGFKEIEKTEKLSFGGNYIEKVFTELKSSLKGSMLEYALAHYIHSIYEQNNYNKELIDEFSSFKKKFPASKLLPWLKTINNNIVTYHENLKKNNPNVKFIDVPDNLQVHDLFDLLKSDKINYIDMWATWCLPCRMELKYAISLHPEFEKIGVNTVYLSFDRAADKEKWMNMSKSLGLVGRNLLATKTLQKQLHELLPNFNGIPRYIILSPEGKLLNTDAKRPTDQLELLKQLKQYADEYNKK